MTVLQTFIDRGRPMAGGILDILVVNRNRDGSIFLMHGTN